MNAEEIVFQESPEEVDAVEHTSTMDERKSTNYANATFLEHNSNANVTFLEYHDAGGAPDGGSGAEDSSTG
ncbi:unnamed protein product [Amoebophrya sp. A25]|nr:unnamed protein product [Amoebophrya sp. A25]